MSKEIDAALERARSMDQPAFISVRATAPTSERGDGPLAGIPIAIKDNIDVAGFATTLGYPPRENELVDTSAAAAARLEAAGAVVIGKTNMDQFATGLVGTRSPYGACHSIYSKQHISGGSSSGSAVAVASGIVPLALGTDTAGSGRVPAAFNGLVGMKPSRGIISNRGVFPAARSLDCVTTFTRTVALTRTAFELLVGPDAADPYSRALPAPGLEPVGIAAQMRVIGVPDDAATLDLDPEQQQAWEAALEHAATVATLVPVDISSMLEAAALLYTPALTGERYAAFGSMLADEGPDLDPTVRGIVNRAISADAASVFVAQDRLQALGSRARAAFVAVDALLLPVTPGHPTTADVAADPVGVNARLGRFTNMVNLLDLCAIVVPAGMRSDGLPFGAQLVAPAFADRSLLDLASRWCGEQVEPVLPTPSSAADGRCLVAVAGAHLTGQPLNQLLQQLNGRLHARTRTAPGYRMYRVPGPLPRPGLARGSGDAQLEIELWSLPYDGLGRLLTTVDPPLSIGQVELADASSVVGFVTDPTGLTGAADITRFGSWRAYLTAGYV